MKTVADKSGDFVTHLRQLIDSHLEDYTVQIAKTGQIGGLSECRFDIKSMHRCPINKKVTYVAIDGQEKMEQSFLSTCSIMTTRYFGSGQRSLGKSVPTVISKRRTESITSQNGNSAEFGLLRMTLLKSQRHSFMKYANPLLPLHQERVNSLMTTLLFAMSRFSLSKSPILMRMKRLICNHTSFR